MIPFCENGINHVEQLKYKKQLSLQSLYSTDSIINY